MVAETVVFAAFIAYFVPYILSHLSDLLGVQLPTPLRRQPMSVPGPVSTVTLTSGSTASTITTATPAFITMAPPK